MIRPKQTISFIVDDKEIGPFTEKELFNKYVTGDLSGETLAASPNSEKWVPVKTLLETAHAKKKNSVRPAPGPVDFEFSPGWLQRGIGLFCAFISAMALLGMCANVLGSPSEFPSASIVFGASFGLWIFLGIWSRLISIDEKLKKK